MVALKGSNALIVGAGRGLGRATARRLAREGANLVLVSRTAEELRESADEMRQLGAKAVAVQADVTQENDVANLANEASRAFAELDIIINCAGLSMNRQLPEMTVDEWTRTVEGNFKGVFLVMRQFLPGMMERGVGQIINISSRTAVNTTPRSGVYGAAKAGVIVFSRAWAEAAKECGVKVLAIAPGPMDTPMRWAATPEFGKDRVVSADDIADLLFWIVSHPNVTFDDAIVPVSLFY